MILKSTLLKITFVLFIGIFQVNSQTSTYNPLKTFTKIELESDFVILTKALKEGHPGIYTFLTPDSLEYYIKQTNSKLKDGLTEADFHILIREFIAHIKCGHTVAMPSKEFYEYYRGIGFLLPFEIFLVNDRIYIRENFSSDSLLKIGSELVSIDSHPVQEMINSMKSFQSRDGNSTTFIRHSIQDNFKTYYLFLYGMNQNYKLVYLDSTKTEKETIVIGEIRKSISKPIQFDSLKYSNDVSTFEEKLFLSNENKTLAILKIQGFQKKKYKDFYKESFQIIADNKIENLVIDLRDNGGGYFPNAVELLSYLMKDEYDIYFSHPKIKYTMGEYTTWDFFSKLTKRMFSIKPDFIRKKGQRTYQFMYNPKKKNHFNGKIYILTNGGTFSMSSHVSAYLKNNNILIGEETGGGEAGSNAILVPRITLPATNVRVVIPYYKLEHSVSKDALGRGVMPTYPISYSIEDLLNEKDLDMEKLFELIKQD